MKNVGKISIILISIVFIFLFALSTVSAESIAIGDGNNLSSTGENYAIANDNSVNGMAYGSVDSDSRSVGLDPGSSDLGSGSGLESSSADIDYPYSKVAAYGSDSKIDEKKLSESVGTLNDLKNEINNASDVLNLTRDYKYDNSVDHYYGVSITKNIIINGGGHTIDGLGSEDIRNSNVGAHFLVYGNYTLVLNDLNLINGDMNTEGGSICNKGGTVILNNCNFTNNVANKLVFVSNLPRNNGGYGGAIYARDGNIFVNNCNFNNNHAYYGSTSDGQGGAIYLYNGNLVINNSNFTGNQGPGGGGAVFNWYGNAVINNSQFIHNSGDNNAGSDIFGGAINNFANSVMTIENSNFTNNYVNGGTSGFEGYGGAISSYGDLTVLGCEFSGNYVQDSYGNGGAINIEKGGTLYLYDSTFINNHVKANGGALSNDNKMVVVNSNFINNTANTGDAIYNTKNLNLSNNNVTGDRVGIYSTGSSSIVSPYSLSIMDGQNITVFDPNVQLYSVLSDDSGNMIEYAKFKFLIDGEEELAYSSYDQVEGKYLYNYSFLNPETHIIGSNLEASSILVAQVNFAHPLILLQELIDNASEGDEINLSSGYAYIDDYDSNLKINGITISKDIIINGNTVKIDGIGLSRLFRVINGANLVLNNITLANGDSLDGGAIYLNNGSLSISNSLFINNSAQRGGAIYSNGSLEIKNSSFTSNDADVPAYGMGGAIYNIGESILSDVNFTENSAFVRGGAIYSEGFMNMSSSNFSNNSARFAGAVYANADLIVEDSSFTYNNASTAGAILFESIDAELEIDNSTFNSNSADLGGAIALYGKASIVNSSFKNNRASLDGGSIYNYGGNATVMDSNFTANNAGRNGDSIYTNNELSLFNNNISSSKAEIYNTGMGTLDSLVRITILDSGSQSISALKYNLTAKIVDDAGNLIQYEDFTFFVRGEALENTIFVEESGEYSAEYTFDSLGTYNITAKYGDERISISLTIENSLSLLQYLIDNAEGDSIDLTYGFNYNENLDDDLRYIGVIVNKTITINGNGFNIDGMDSSKLFHVAEGANLTLNNITLERAFACPSSDLSTCAGGAIFVEEKGILNIYESNLTNNRGDYGGAICQYGNSGVNIVNCNFKDNKASFDGGAIYIFSDGEDSGLDGGSASIFYGDGDSSLDDESFGYINIDGSIFDLNNCVGYGGAIALNSSSHDLTISNTRFEYNNAYYGATISFRGSNSTEIASSDGGSLGMGSSDGGSLGMGSSDDDDLIQSTYGRINLANSNFTINSATYKGGAIYNDNRNLTLSNLVFDSNRADMGKDIYNNGSEASIINLSNSNIINSEASIYNENILYLYDNTINTEGIAIYNNKSLCLYNNTITGPKVAIYNNLSGSIESPFNAVILNGETVHIYSPYINLTAVVYDDNGNYIYDANFKFTGLGETVPFDSFDNETGICSKLWQFTEAGIYNIGADYADENVVSGKVVIASLKTLEKLINANTNGTLDLDDNYIYIDFFDESIKNGILITKNISINGNYHVLSGSNSSRLFNVSSNTTLDLSGLTIMDFSYDIYPGGGAIYFEGDHLNINSSIFINNHALGSSSDGGAIYLKGLDHQSILYLQVPCDGGAIYLKGGAMNLSNSRFMYNSARNLGGAIFAYSDSDFINIIGCEFINNFANSSGGAVYCGNSLIYGSKFIGNLAIKSTIAYGGALVVRNTSLIDYCEFINNMGMFGGAIIIFSSSNISNSLFEGNQATIAGGIVFFGENSSIKDSVFRGNKAYNGSAIYQLESNLHIGGVNFTQNMASSSGAIMIDKANTVINNSVFDLNIGPNEKCNIDRSIDSNLTLENNLFKQTLASISTEKAKYLSGEDVKLMGSFIWGVSNTEITLGILELNGKGNFTPENFMQGNFNFSKSGLADGVYYLSLSSFTDENGNMYLMAPVDTKFAVGDVKLRITLEINDTYVSDDVIAEIYAYDENDNSPVRYFDLLLVVNGTEYNVTIGSEGRIYRNMGKFEPMSYTGIIYSVENEMLPSAFDHDEFIVSEVPLPDMNFISFDIHYSNLTYGQSLDISVDSVKDKDGNPVDGFIIVDIISEGEKVTSISIIVEEGSGSASLGELLLPANYILNASFRSDEIENYTSQVIESKLTVDKDNLIISVTLDNITYGQDASVDIKLDSSVSDSPIDVPLYVYLDGILYANPVVNGTVHLDISQLPAEGHSLEIEVDVNDSRYYGSTKKVTFNVAKASPILKVESESVEWGNPATIKLSIIDENGKSINGTAVVRVSWEIDGVDQYIDIQDGEGEVVFAISDLVGPGTYDVTVFYKGGDNYNDVNATAKLTLTGPKDVNVDVEVEAGNYGEITNVTVTLTDKAHDPIEGAKVNVSIDDGEAKEYALDENGAVTLPIEGLGAGAHNVTVKFDDGVHEAAEVTEEFSVDPASGADIKFAAEDVEYGDDYPIKITAVDADDVALDGKAIIVLDGNAIAEVDIKDGEGEYNITDLEVGGYYLELVFDNPNYLPSSYGDKIYVTKANPTLNVAHTIEEWGKPATIRFGAWDKEDNPLNGTAIVRVSWQVDGIDQFVDIENGIGEATFEISSFVSPGLYDVFVFFQGGRNYNDVNGSAKLMLSYPTEMNIELEVEAGSYGETTNVTVILIDKANIPVEDAPVTLIIGDDEYNAISDENGTVTIPISGLDAGEHKIIVKVDDKMHDPTEVETTVTIAPASGADIEASVKPGAVGEDSVVDVNVVDPDGKALGGNVIVQVDGEAYDEIALDENGTASFSIKDLAIGEHTVEVTFDNPNYLPSTYTTHFEVKAKQTELTVTVDKESIIYGDGKVTATINVLCDGQGVDGLVEVLLNGQLQNITLAGGKATVEYDDLAAGNYTVVANYPETTASNSASDSANFNVERKATQFKYGNMTTTAFNYKLDGRVGPYFEFTLLDSDGNPLANKDVNLGVNGASYVRQTNATGGARVQVNLMIAGLYTFAIAFLGDENYTGVFNVALITVNAQSPKLTTSAKTYKASAKTKTLTATLKTSRGNALSGKKVTFTVNGKSYTAKTNAKGLATVKVSLTKKGTYSFTVKTIKDSTYAAVSKTAKLVIK